MSLRPRSDRNEGREPKEHCLNLDDTNGSLLDLSDSCNRQQSVEAAATSPISVGQSKLVEIMEASKAGTKDILEQAKLKLIEVCTALEADYRTVMCAIDEIRANENKAARINFDCDVVKLNVGGQLFETSIETFKKYGPNLFTQLFSGEGNVKQSADGCYFFDRDGVHFRHILNYMRHGHIPNYVIQQCKDELLFEAEYYGLNSLVEYLHNGDAVSASIEKGKCVDEGSSCMLSVLKCPGMIDEVVGCLNKACLSLDGDIANIGSREQQKYKADLCIPHVPNEVVKLNVGGVFFQTNLSTLMKEKDSLLFSLVTGKLESYQSNDGFFYIDRDGTRFKHILNFLRDGLIPQKVFCEMGEELMIEANFFEISSLKKALTVLMHMNSKENDKTSATEDVNCTTQEVLEGCPIGFGANIGNILAEKFADVFGIINEKFAAQQEEFDTRMTRNIDSLKHGLKAQMLEVRSGTSDIRTEVEKNICSILEKSSNIEDSLSKQFGDGVSKQIKEAYADCKRILEKFDALCSVSQSDFRDIKHKLNEVLLKCSNKNSGMYAKITDDIKQFIKTSLQLAFEGHEDRLELEMIAHKSPSLCAFSKSDILRNCMEYKACLHRFLIETKCTGQIQLIYSLKKDGAHCFHYFCDNKPPTLILVKANTGNIFGGFTFRFWNKGTRATMKDPKAFVFSLKNDQHTKPFLKFCSGGCVKLGSSEGPAFGKTEKSKFKAEFMIDEHKSVSTISGGFTLCRNYAVFSKDLNSINLAGSEEFSVDNMEVFTIDDIDSSESE